MAFSYRCRAHGTAPLLFALVVLSPPLLADDYQELQRLSADFWQWRAVTQPASGDDIPRVERPEGWLPGWNGEPPAQRLERLAQLEQRLARITGDGFSVAQEVDRELVASALARVRWELEVHPSWRRNPLYWVDQAEVPVFESLLAPAPFDEARIRTLIARLEHVPTLLDEARSSLDRRVGPFVELAVKRLEGVEGRFETMATELDSTLDGAANYQLRASASRAGAALADFRSWLERESAQLPNETAIGRDAYHFFLERVACMPFEPAELVAMARQELERAVVLETVERLRNVDLGEQAMFDRAGAQIEQEAKDSRTVRQFLEQKNLLTVPEWTGQYLNRSMPAYLQPLAHAGVYNDLTGPSRRGADGFRYILDPSPELGYFHLSMARDPRPILVHEGIPGHYFQLSLSWNHDNPIRRHYYDSGANEGLGFYAEEMMLQAGYFDDRPRTREVIYNFMRLRALRVEVDVKLALGEFTIDQAADYLERVVPMPQSTAREEAAFFASTPGQAISYQIGKLQVVRLLSELRLRDGDAFSLREAHDFLWRNGNVPIALLRRELLSPDRSSR